MRWVKHQAVNEHLAEGKKNRREDWGWGVCTEVGILAAGSRGGHRGHPRADAPWPRGTAERGGGAASGRRGTKRAEGRPADAGSSGRHGSEVNKERSPGRAQPAQAPPPPPDRSPHRAGSGARPRPLTKMRLKRLLSLGGSCTFGIAAGGEDGCSGAAFRWGWAPGRAAAKSRAAGDGSVHGLELRPLGRDGNGKGTRPGLGTLRSRAADRQAVAAAPARSKMAAVASPLERGGVRLRRAPRGQRWRGTPGRRDRGVQCWVASVTGTSAPLVSHRLYCALIARLVARENVSQTFLVSRHSGT